LGEGDRSSGVRLRNAVDLADLSELLAARVSYIAFNLTIWQDYAREQLDLETCIDRIAARHGPPVHRDADLVVFAVESQP
jgi:hypothetical protein